MNNLNNEESKDIFMEKLKEKVRKGLDARTLCGSCHNLQSSYLKAPFFIILFKCSEDLNIIPPGDNRCCYKYDSEGKKLKSL